MKILVVEDEETAASFLVRGLTEEGYVVDRAATGDQAELCVADHDYDAILLDVMLPGADGFSLCRSWRQRGLRTPVLFVTARDALAERIQGLDLGGDDYLIKPFAFEELLARLRACLRRAEAPRAAEAIDLGRLRLEPTARRVWVDGQELELTAREYLLLEVLARRHGQVVSRTVLWEQAWETGSEPSSNVVDVYIGYLRHKLGPLSAQLQTVRGAGYRLCSPD